MELHKLTTARQVLQHVRHERLQPRPCSILLYLNKSRRLIKEIAVPSEGWAAAALNSRDLFQPALRVQAEYLIIVQILPSTNRYPDREFIEQINSVEKIGSYLGVKLFDCIQASTRDYFSFRENGLLYPATYLEALMI